MGFWTVGGVLVGEPNGVLIDCDRCPCDEENVFCCLGISFTCTTALLKGLNFPYPKNITTQGPLFGNIAEEMRNTHTSVVRKFLIDPKNIHQPTPGALKWSVSAPLTYEYPPGTGGMYTDTAAVCAHRKKIEDPWDCGGSVEIGGNIEYGYSYDTGSGDPPELVWTIEPIYKDTPPSPNAYQQSLPPEYQ